MQHLLKPELIYLPELSAQRSCSTWFFYCFTYPTVPLSSFSGFDSHLIRTYQKSHTYTHSLAHSTMARSLPNIIITGTPGTGKTTHCEILAEKTGLKHLSVNQVVKEKECHEGWDEEYQSWIVDEDKVGFP